MVPYHTSWITLPGGSPWLEETNAQMHSRTGPEAPQSFSLAKRKNLGFIAVGDGKAEWTTTVQARLPAKGEPNHAPDPEDVVMVVNDWMASAVAQIVVVIPASEIPYLRGLPEQPQGLWPRMPMSEKGSRGSAAQSLQGAGSQWYSPKGMRLPHRVGYWHSRAPATA